VRADRKESESIEKYRISKNAVYFEGQYLPTAQITALRAQPSLYYPQCCCGRGIPVTKIRLDYGAEKPVILMVEKDKSAQRLIDAIRAGNPEVVVEEYVDPHAEG
jgi:hypothetical protein